MSKDNGTNRIWIELPYPKGTNSEEFKARAEELCAKANAMLKKLMPAAEMSGYSFFWSTRDYKYCFGGHMGYKILADNGEWFDLDILSQPHVVEPPKPLSTLLEGDPDYDMSMDEPNSRTNQG